MSGKNRPKRCIKCKELIFNKIGMRRVCKECRCKTTIQNRLNKIKKEDK